MTEAQGVSVETHVLSLIAESVNPSSLTESYLMAIMQMQSTALTTVVSHIPLAAPFITGFTVGFKKG